VVSFGEVLAVPWKSNLVLDCLHVGSPAPAVQWLHKMRPLQENSKHQVWHAAIFFYQKDLHIFSPWNKKNFA
jgi:hypothetical protein